MFGSITVIKNALDNYLVCTDPKKTMIIGDAVKVADFPIQPRVRVIGDKDDIENVRSLLKNYKIVPSLMIVRNASSEIAQYTGGGNDDTNTLDNKMSQLAHLNSPDCWENYMTGVDGRKTHQVTEWIHNATKMLIPCESYSQLPPAILDVSNKRNKTIQDKLDLYEQSVSGTNTGVHTVVLKHMQWDYLMCYGENNIFDFEKLDGKVALLNGQNAMGKSAFLDVLCIALFGEPTSSRREFTGNNMTAKIINDHKPTAASSSTHIWIDVDGVLYEIHRTFKNYSQEDKADFVKSDIISVYRCNETDREIVAEGATVVDKWVTERFGTIDEVLMSTILCQSDTTNFFCKKTADQKMILEKALHMETITAFVAVLEEAVKAHKFVLDKVASYQEGMNDSISSEPRVTAKEVQDMEYVAEVCTDKMAALQEQNNNLLAKIGDLRIAEQASSSCEEDPGEVLDGKKRALDQESSSMGGQLSDGDISSYGEKRAQAMMDLGKLEVNRERLLGEAEQLSINVSSENDTRVKKAVLTKARKALDKHEGISPLRLQKCRLSIFKNAWMPPIFGLMHKTQSGSPTHRSQKVSLKRVLYD